LPLATRRYSFLYHQRWHLYIHLCQPLPYKMAS
jgi:hypothetical protein